MVFEELTAKVNRILEDRREGPQKFDFTIDKVVKSVGERIPTVTSHDLFVNRQDGTCMAPEYLSYVKLPFHPFTELLVEAWKQCHKIRFRGEYSLEWVDDPILIFMRVYSILAHISGIYDSFRGEIIVEDRKTGKEIKRINTTFEYYLGKDNGMGLEGIQPRAKLPPVEVDRGVGYYMLQAHLDPAEHPINDADDYLMVLSCGYCNTGMLYSQPRTSDKPKKIPLSCDSCGSKDLTTLYQNF